MAMIWQTSMQNKTLITLKTLLLLTLITNLLFLTKANAMQIEKPVYYLKLDMYACPRMVDINGVEIEHELKGHASAAEYPINQWIRNGENTISIHYGPENFMKARTNEQSRCNASVWVRGTSEGKSIDFKVTDLDYTPNYDLVQEDRHKSSIPAGKYTLKNNSPELVDNEGDFETGQVKIGAAEFNVRGGRIYRSFSANVPFPEWAFFSGEKVYDFYPKNDDKYDQMKAIIWPLVEDLRDKFESKDIDNILPLFEFRSKELDMAYYRTPGETLDSFKTSLEYVYDADYPLDRIEIENMQLIVAYNEKLVTIANAATLNGTIHFYDKTDNTYTFFDLMWMKKDGKWIIAR